jgi:membrane protein YdbS with pleckstrin-like domain
VSTEIAPSSETAPEGDPSIPTALQADNRPRRLDARTIPCSRLSGVVFGVCAGLAGALVLTLARKGGSEALPLVRGWLPLVVLVLGFLLFSWFYPPLRYRCCTWRLSGFGLEIREGVWFRRLISVPRSRVQHIEVQRGPLQSRFGIASLVVHTAGHQDSEIRLSGLEHHIALLLRDDLLRSDGDSEHGSRIDDGS